MKPASERMREHLAPLYGEELAPDIAARIERLIAGRKGTVGDAGAASPGDPWSERSAMLFTYADSIIAPGEAPLRMLGRFLRTHAGASFTHVHLLPFYPYTSDDGFAVTDYRAVRSDLGDWDDIHALARDFRLVFDAVINHVSASSTYMRDYCAGNPNARNFFVALDPATDTSGVLRTRNLPLLHPYETVRGTEWLWTTFGPDQVDLNFANPAVLLEVLDVLLGYVDHGASVLRLDAIPYLWKRLGTSCAHLPETHVLICLLRDVLDLYAPGVLLLSETNCPHHENIAYFGRAGDEAQMVYNFTLAPLVAHALLRGDATCLATWARGVAPAGARTTFLNVTATHDGIGMRPTEGILPESERQMLCDLARQRGAGITGKRNADGSFGVYELNVTYFDLLNDPAADEPSDVLVRRFLVAQAISIAFVGIPGIYLHSFLGSRNDMDAVRRTGRNRSVNRAQLTADALESELADASSLRGRVRDGIASLLAARAREPAFHPRASQEVPEFGPEVFAILRCDPVSGHRVLALHNLAARERSVVEPKEFEGARDLLDGCRSVDGSWALQPYQVRWLRTEG